MIIAVGSHNPVKIGAARSGFQRVLSDPDIVVIGHSVSSGVSDQPMSVKESIAGATARAEKALRAEVAAEYGVGLEGGIHIVDDHHAFQAGWAVVVNRAGIVGCGSSIHLELPDGMLEEITATGRELGAIVDTWRATSGTGRGKGFFGIMTNDAITREMAYADAVVCALSSVLHSKSFDLRVATSDTAR